MPIPRFWKLIAHDHGQFGLVGGVRLHQPADSHDLARAGAGIVALGHESHLAVIVDEAHTREALVLGALLQFHPVEVAHVHAAFGERVMKIHQRGFVFRADGPDGDLGCRHRAEGASRSAWDRAGWPGAAGPICPYLFG